MKIDSKLLRKNKWCLTIPTPASVGAESDFVVAVGESQLIRWIDVMKDKDNANAEIIKTKRKIRKIKNSAENSKTKTRIKKLYQELNELKFIPDLVSVVMSSNADYDRANKGFEINGIQFRRLLGTPNGIKKSTILYINQELYPEIMRRIENGRNTEKELVAAKLEAYRALTCSGSVPIPKPNGIIVVKDCITKFKEDVIVIRDSDGDEPIFTNETDYEIEHNNSDGFGLMLPSYAAKVNSYLTNGNDTSPLSAMVIRYSFTKGLLVTFDFVEFAEQIANNYFITDVWGTPRDLREAEVILTESQLKLWDSYANWEEYKKNCNENFYDFAVTKTCPMELENVHTTNYQFLQPYDFTDAEIKELCQPTLTQIQNVMGLDYRQAIVYLTGGKLEADSFDKVDDYVIQALMAGGQPEINDPFVIERINTNIKKQIERAERGKLIINANFAMISGDPYALCQSMFGIDVTGLLNKGEVYHKYWVDKGTKEIACFRAPMSVINAVRKQKLCKSDMAAHWYQYIKTVCVLNAWDSTAEAEDGADFDGDLFYCTDNDIILRHTDNQPTVISIQNKAQKTKPTEDDIIQANKLAFNDRIGIITNAVTAMYDLRAKYPKNSDEYKELQYRIICGQHFQQGEIDRAKGADVKTMPQHWKYLIPNKEYTDLQRAIVANKKPMFFKYVYPEKKKKYDTQFKNFTDRVEKEYGQTFDVIQQTNPELTETLLNDFYSFIELTDNDCTVNRISRHIEKEMNSFRELQATKIYDYSVLKSNADYSKITFNRIKERYQEYKIKMKELAAMRQLQPTDKEEMAKKKQKLQDEFRKDCDVICPQQAVLCDILVDLVYSQKGSKDFAWMLCGEQIVKNLLAHNGNIIMLPIIADDDFDFNYNDRKYKVIEFVKELISNERERLH